MGRKLLGVLASACVLVGVLVGPASASASTLTLYDGLEEALEPADPVYFANGGGLKVNATLQKCETFELETEVTENEADPVTLQLTGANLEGCSWGSSWLKFSEIESPYPMILNADGTGALFLRVKEEVSWGLTCVREGVLNLTHSEGLVTAAGYMQAVTFPCPGLNWKATFGPTYDEFGEITWVVTP